MDAERYSASLIQRVLEYGTLQDWRLTRDFYGISRVVAECKKLRTLDPMALSFVCAVSDTNKEDYRCYQFRQSNPTLWNSLGTSWEEMKKTIVEAVKRYQQ